ncbi:MAG TPA: RHS repeat-associated core domain-containing protein [Candidatus Kapabacteria bacterium]|nr:RHS repeat-associated core domain-containing protein [Candidatus Kapabacteria bacterium]
MIKDLNSEINNIEWTADGKIKLIDKPGTTILFYYDAQGNRTCKVDATNKVEYYLRDANGQLLEILEFDITNPNGGGGFPVEWCTIRTIVGTHGVQQNKGKKDDGKKDKQAENKLQSSDPLSWDFEPTDLLSLNEPTAINPFLSTINTDVDNLDFTSNQWFVYGSESHGRFVTIRSDANHGGYNTGLLSNDIMEEARYLNTKFYELKDHLGNVRVVLRDWKLNPNNDGLPPFNAQPVEVFNYYAYGMMIPGFFSNSTPDYRFGFNGMLRDDDVRDEKLTSDNEGRGNSYDFGARILDPRVGRFLSLDPLMGSFPWQSPYLFAGNDPIRFIDVDGKYKKTVNYYQDENGNQTVLSVVKDNSIRPYSSSLFGLQPIIPNLVEYVRWDANGNKISTSGELNLWNIGSTRYCGALNPDELSPNIPDYRYPPLNSLDKAALIHDKDYDPFRVKGPSGMLGSLEVLKADMNLTKSALEIVKMFINGDIDPITKSKIDIEQVTGAAAVALLFGGMSLQKATRIESESLINETRELYKNVKNTVSKLSNGIQESINTQIEINNEREYDDKK